MNFVKLCVLAMIGAFAITSTHAASLQVPGKSDSTAMYDLVKKKKGKKKKSKAGKCGEYKYWSKKAKKCEDARKKKK